MARTHNERFIDARQAGDFEKAIAIAWDAIARARHFNVCSEFLMWGFVESGNVDGLKYLRSRVKARTDVPAHWIEPEIARMDAQVPHAQKVREIIDFIAATRGVTIRGVYEHYNVHQNKAEKLRSQKHLPKEQRSADYLPRGTFDHSLRPAIYIGAITATGEGEDAVLKVSADLRYNLSPPGSGVPRSKKLTANSLHKASSKSGAGCAVCCLLPLLAIVVTVLC